MIFIALSYYSRVVAVTNEKGHTDDPLPRVTVGLVEESF